MFPGIMTKLTCCFGKLKKSEVSDQKNKPSRMFVHLCRSELSASYQRIDAL